MHWYAVAVCLLSVVLPSADDEAPRGRLTVHTNQLLYRGQPVRLCGVAVGDIHLWHRREAAREYRTLAREWKANAVRLSIHPGTWKDHKDEALQLLQDHTRAALAEGLFVLIAYHAIGFPDGYTQKSFSGAGDTDRATHMYDSRSVIAEDFWDTVSRKINDGRVLFELWNEPVSRPDEDLEAAEKTWPQLKRFYEKLTAVIRRNSNNSVILAAGGKWAYCLRGVKADLLPDAQTAYTWHVYAGHDRNDPKRWTAALDGLHRVRPVLVTEWGFEPGARAHYKGTAADFGDRFRDEILEGLGLHSTAWCFLPGWGPSLQRGWGRRTRWGDFAFAYLNRANAQAVRP